MSYYHGVAPDKTSFVRRRRCSFKTREMFYFLSQIQSILQSCNSTGWPCHTTAVLRLCQTHILSAHTDHQHDMNPFPPATAWRFSFSCVCFCQHPVKPFYYLVWVILSRGYSVCWSMWQQLQVLKYATLGPTVLPLGNFYWIRSNYTPLIKVSRMLKYS